MFLNLPYEKKNTWGASYPSASYAPLDLRGLVSYFRLPMMGLVSYFRAKSESLVLIAGVLVGRDQFILGEMGSFPGRYGVLEIENGILEK